MGVDIGYDEFSGFVCYAESSELARHMKPWPTPEFGASEYTIGYYEKYGNKMWPVKPEDLNVEYLGKAILGTESRTILSSFRKG